MAVTSKDLRSDEHSRGRVLLARRFHTAAYGVTLLLLVLVVYGVVGIVLQRGTVLWDDLRYGRPRTFHVYQAVGHEDSAERPTHLIALNLERQIVVLELPGGDAAKTRSITGPYLFGANEDLTPVTIDLHDMDGDGSADMLLNVRDEQIVYLNRDGSFRLPTPDEQAHIKVRIGQ